MQRAQSDSRPQSDSCLSPLTTHNRRCCLGPPKPKPKLNRSPCIMRSPETKQPLLSIREVSVRSGLPASTLRFYEERGLIKAHRFGSSQRHFPRVVLRLLAFIVFAQKIGYSLDEIAEQLATLPSNTAPVAKDWQRLSRSWKERVACRIEELRRLHIDLDECIGCGCLSLKRCKLSNPHDRLGRNGPGARRWLGDPTFEDNE